MITKEHIERINHLARKSKTEGLTEKEKQEQKELRELYIKTMRQSLKSQLDSIKIINPDDKT
ncbi:DUF896 domain-containing protein [Microaerobacter geothermalis]|uniref:DUF896 domain-containing protein n=1 Tax=Microaerobacter geothermalis TaxID=674972 RepID=UPI001F2693FE|nr:DUF896 domain-containing protein [Microaerobacter geothermalis]MCF6093113.1 DUF896 domain-containing protein [Microaerobacter geothermalis]